MCGRKVSYRYCAAVTDSIPVRLADDRATRSRQARLVPAI